MKEISISTGPLQRKYGDEKALKIAKAAGFDAVDFNLEGYGMTDDCIYHASEDAFGTYFTSLKKKAEELGIRIGQTHGRCGTFAPEKDRCDFVRFVTERDLKATMYLGSPACVIHSISTMSWGIVPPEVMREENQKMFSEFIPLAEEYRVKISQETFGDAVADGVRVLDFFGDVHELKAQHEQLETSWKTLCMDTGHVNKATAFGIMPAEEAIRLLGKDITLTHLHDNNTFSDQHLPPKMGGTINWGNVFDAFDEIGYSGTYNFELALDYFGDTLEDAVIFLGKYLRKFVDGRGIV
ncbi:MAG: sugar phosphate isomerase/epimerase [Clostridia bacterium]|nr:sugar phosphate isomerase/epimerase [Clostridia bacterium]